MTTLRLLIVACSAAAALAVGLSVHASPRPAGQPLNATAQDAF
jgi:hypothetical protein